MEDFQLDIVIGKGPSARSIRLDLPRFTLVGATTRTGLITGPLRDRFGFIARLDYYEADDLVAILERSARILGVPLEHRGRGRDRAPRAGTPRIANRLLKRVRDYAEVRGDGTVDVDRSRRARAVRGRRARSRQGRPGDPHRAVRHVRRPTGRPRHAGRRGGRGARDGRRRLRAVPAEAGPPAAHATRPGRDALGVRPPRCRATAPARPACSTTRRRSAPAGARLLLNS